MNAFDIMIQQFYDVLTIWEASGLSIAKNLFAILAAIQVAWAAVLWLLNRNEGMNIIAEYAKMLMVIGFFWAVLLNYNTWVPAIYGGLQHVGEQMSGTASLSPGDVFKTGLTMATHIYHNTEAKGFWESIGGSILSIACGAVLFYVFIRIAIEMVILLIGGKIILAGGLVLLAFAGTKWTMSYAERYFTFAITLGVRLLLITLVVGLGQTLADGWINLINNPPGDEIIQTYLTVIGAALLYLGIAIKVPEMGASALTGSLSLNGFSGMAGAAVAAGTAAGVKAGMMAAQGASATAKEGAGAVAALRAATGAAHKQGVDAGLTGMKLASSVPPAAIRSLSSAGRQVATESFEEFKKNMTKDTVGGRVANQINLSGFKGKRK